ncbi:uncharacterized protein [Medicago truncatula]|uniref:uncharacterized protein n=1 Tax=Medicago truncatula TaxID=3880 RepID=UPI0000D5F5C4|nr:uncharacterized protein LOC112420884 [Medicago truncatula]
MASAAHQKSSWKNSFLKERQPFLDGKGEIEELSALEFEKLHGISSDIHSFSQSSSSICWQQSTLQWLREGDANSKCFYSILLGRLRRNALVSIMVDGAVVEGVQPIRQAMFSHFSMHFQANREVRPFVDNLVFNTPNYAEGSGLTKPFSEEEVKAAVWDCDSFKSPGPDGVNFGFFKDFWLDMKSYIMHFLVEFHRNGKLSREQSAFVQNRQFLDGILIANEVFEVDFEKAYDSVDSSFLDSVMDRMYFPFLWRKWIKECISAATTYVLVNGSTTDEFPLGRGLRQGDPFSPFLFLLAAEGLNVMMKSLFEKNIYASYKVDATSLVLVTHLQFVDDTLLLGVKSWANVRSMRAVLLLFEALSGLKVNFHKSMLVGVNISDSWLNEAASVL